MFIATICCVLLLSILMTDVSTLPVGSWYSAILYFEFSTLAVNSAFPLLKFMPPAMYEASLNSIDSARLLYCELGPFTLISNNARMSPTYAISPSLSRSSQYAEEAKLRLWLSLEYDFMLVGLSEPPDSSIHNWSPTTANWSVHFTPSWSVNLTFPSFSICEIVFAESERCMVMYK